MGFELVPRSPLNAVHIPAKANKGSDVIETKSHDILFLSRGIRLRREFGEAVGGDETSVLWLQPTAPVRRRRSRLKDSARRRPIQVCARRKAPFSFSFRFSQRESLTSDRLS